MTPPTMPRIKKLYSRMYDQLAKYPELAKFRRYLPQWFWILENEIYEIEQQIKICDDALGASFSITDYHLAFASEDDREKMHDDVERLKGLLRQYGDDLLMTHQITNLPEQNNKFARSFAKRDSYFDDGIFGPTGESATLYSEVPAGHDFWSPKAVEEQDPITEFVTAHLDSMYTWYHTIIRKLSGRTSEADCIPERDFELKTIETRMNIVVAVFVPVLLSCTLGALSALDSELKRIVVLGAFGLLLGLSLISVAQKLKRSELFAIICAYFAVGGIFIGAKSNGSI